MPIWHHEMRDFYIEPSYQYQAEIISLRTMSTVPETDLLASTSSSQGSFEKLLILYGSVTGTAEGYAYKARKTLRPLHVDVKGCEKVDVKTLGKEMTGNGGPYSAVLFIVSTFGEGGRFHFSGLYHLALPTNPLSQYLFVVPLQTPLPTQPTFLIASRSSQFRL